MNKKKILILISFCLLIGILFPELAHASLETSLNGVKAKLTGVILPLL